jgi:hypothetical protein
VSRTPCCPVAWARSCDCACGFCTPPPPPPPPPPAPPPGSCVTTNAADDQGEPGTCAGWLAAGMAACNPDLFQGGQYAGL